MSAGPGHHGPSHRAAPGEIVRPELSSLGDVGTTGGRWPRGRRTLVAAAVSLVLALTACGGQGGAEGEQPKDGEEATSASASPAAAPVRIATGTDGQTRVIAHLYQQRLEDAGVKATVVNVGATRPKIFTALKQHRVDVVPEFTGDLYVYTRTQEKPASPSAVPTLEPTATPTPGPTGVLDSLGELLGSNGSTGPSADEVYDALPDALPKGLTVLEQSGAERTDALVTTTAVAAKYQLTDMRSLTKHCPKLSVGMPGEYEDTAQGLPGLEAYYECVPGTHAEMPDPAKRVDALENQRVQTAVLPVSSPAIDDGALVTLEDPANLFRPERLVPLTSGRIPEEARSVLNTTTTELKSEDLTLITRLVSGDNPAMKPQEAAQFLQDRPR